VSGCNDIMQIYFTRKPKGVGNSMGKSLVKKELSAPRNIRSARWCLFMGLALLLFIGGCLQVPRSYRTIGRESAVDTPCMRAEQCHPGLLAALDTSCQSSSYALDSEGFTLVTWNLQKSQKEGWIEDLSSLTAGADIVLLQEALLSTDLSRLLAGTDKHWDLAPAFVYRNDPVGVLTASKITPLIRCMLRIQEPMLKVPKSILMTHYLFEGGSPHLVVVNLHGINFSLETVSYRNLWLSLEMILVPYAGPLIIAGDFNTWSKARLTIVEQTMARLGLKAISFTEGSPTTFFGNTLDHIYYRDLIPLVTNVPQVQSSDHFPLQVSFRLERAPIK